MAIRYEFLCKNNRQKKVNVKRIERWGSEIVYEIKGSGVPLLLCHGLMGDGSFWDEIAFKLQQNFCLIIPDLRGHRHSPSSLPFTLWDLADDMIAILDAEKIKIAHAVGFSMGGMAALRMAIKYPSRVASLGLISTAACQESLKSQRRNIRLASLIRMTGPLRIFEAMAKKRMFSQTFLQSNPQEMEKIMKSMRRQRGPSVSHAITAVFCRDNIVPFLKNIALPTLILVGTHDKSTPPKWSAEMASHIPHHKFVQLDGAGHLAPTERPEEVTRHLLDFLFQT